VNVVDPRFNRSTWPLKHLCMGQLYCATSFAGFTSCCQQPWQRRREYKACDRPLATFDDYKHLGFTDELLSVAVVSVLISYLCRDVFTRIPRDQL